MSDLSPAPVPLRSLRPHQVEAVDAVVRALAPATGPRPAGGLRASMVAACGTGKTLIAAHVGRRLAAHGRVLVLVPTLDLLEQTVTAWRRAGHGGRMLAVCSLPKETFGQSVRCTTSAPQLALWLADAHGAVVFATYASLPVLVEAHEGPYGITPLTRWDLVVVDEAHRTSGHLGKAWAKIHDNTAVPALRRLYMTATPRVWQARPVREGREDAHQSLPAEMAASMDDQDLFGPVVYRLLLAEAIDRGLLARYEVVVLELRDKALFEAVTAAAADRRDRRLRDRARTMRVQAAQTAVLRAATDLGLERVLTFHHRTRDAREFADTLTATATELARADPRITPGSWWSQWLCGEHSSEHRRQVLDAFARPADRDGVPSRHAVLASVKVLAEGVDLTSDAVVFVDAKESAVDVVQAVGRALRQQPGQGKLARLVVPVFLPVDQPLSEGEDLLLSPAFDHLVTVIQALRSHDENIVEQLAVPQSPSDALLPGPDDAEPDLDLDLDLESDDGGGVGPDDGTRHRGDGAGAVGDRPARAVLRFHVPRSGEALAAFVRLRVLRPESRAWRRGLDAAMRWQRAHHHLRIPVDTMDGAFPLGRWITDQRRFNVQGLLDPIRAEELDALGMVWSVPDAAWQTGLARARQWARVHGHLAAPVLAVQDGYPVGRWLAAQRTAAKQPPREGGLSAARSSALERIDPYWNPTWSLVWQRAFHALAAARAAGLDGQRAQSDGDATSDWAREQCSRWGQLTAGQQQLLSDAGLAADPSPASARVTRRSRGERFALGLRAARASMTARDTSTCRARTRRWSPTRA
jgi:superfamily II DNA or RNA helicase